MHTCRHEHNSQVKLALCAHTHAHIHMHTCMYTSSIIAGTILLVFDLSFGGTLNKSGRSRARLHKVSEDVDGIDSVPEASDLSSGQQSVLQLGRRAPYIYRKSLLVRRSDFHIRNRYLSKVGAKVITSYKHSLL